MVPLTSGSEERRRSTTFCVMSNLYSCGCHQERLGEHVTEVQRREYITAHL